MAESLDIDELQVVGHLILFWSWCDANMSLDCPDVKGTKRGLDRASCRDGMVDALIDVGWLSVRTEDSQDVYTIPNFERHLSKSAKTRANEQRKKKRQRSCPVSNGTNVPKANGTQPGPEKRREEKSNTIYTPGSDVVVPESLKDQSVIDAVGVWISYLSQQHPDKAIESNSPQEEALFRTIATWGAKPAEIVARIDECISRSWANLRKPDQTSRSGGPASDVWGKVIHFAVSDGLTQGYTQRLSDELGVQVANAAKKVGMPAIAQANDFQLNELKKRFVSEMQG